MKLNETSPQQHLMVICGAGACIFLNVLTWWKSGPSADDVKSAQPRVTESVDLATGSVSVRNTKFVNPKLSWYESIFCRGIQRSSMCSYKLLHPFANDQDIPEAMEDGEPKSDHVVYYRGSISKNTSMKNTIEAPEADAPPARIME